MKIKVSEYIADFLVEHGVTQNFTVCGGGSMHLNASFAHNPGIHCIYNHHEQASAIAAEAYARITNKPAICCVTSGPGAINALNGVVGAYQDSIPMLVFSGQTKTTLTVQSSGLNLRTLGNQEVDIVSAVSNMTKYAEMIMDANKIRYCLEKAYKLAVTGRPGPCWIDIPLDVQGKIIDTDDLYGYDDSSEDVNIFDKQKLTTISKEVVNKFLNAKRPVLYAGNGIRLSGGVDLLHKLVNTFHIPVVTCWDSIDLMASDNPYYCGRGGNMGDRPGNFAVQNSDFLLCIGSRLNIYQVGFDVTKWARNAYVVVDDIDAEELKKPIMRADLPVCADASTFMRTLLEVFTEPTKVHDSWIKQCQIWKKNYPVVQERQKNQKGLTNVYEFIDRISHNLPENAVTVVANGSASVAGSAAYYIKQNDRFIMNCALSSMGYDLPAAIGASVALGRKDVICIAGDGSIQMNLQELMTIVTNMLPVKIFVINNSGYQQMRLTERNVFKNEPRFGIGGESGDLGFPDFSKLVTAYGIPYFSIHTNSELDETIKKVIATDGYVLCEVFCDTDQIFEPKSATRILPSGKPVSPPLEDLAPFLSREELSENMYIPMLDTFEKE